MRILIAWWIVMLGWWQEMGCGGECQQGRKECNCERGRKA